MDFELVNNNCPRVPSVPAAHFCKNSLLFKTSNK